MPSRIVREGILSSEAVSQLTWAEEVFYRRLMSVVDDHGRFHALPKLLRAACYPLQIDKVSDADIGKWTTSCVAAGLVSVYPASDGKRYIVIEKFGQQVRSKSKFPEPLGAVCDEPKAPDNSCYQVPADAHLDVFVSEDVVEVEKKTRSRVTTPDGVNDSTWKDFLAIRKAKRAPMTDTALAGIRREAEKAGLTLQRAIEICCERGWQGFKADWVADDKTVQASVTVPSKPGRDPELIRIEEDRKKAVPIPDNIRERLQALAGRGVRV